MFQKQTDWFTEFSCFDCGPSLFIHWWARPFCLFWKRAIAKINSKSVTVKIFEILQDIPSSGIERWYALQKPDGGKSKRQRGDIRVGLTLSTEKDQNVTSHEHRHLLKILFAHELQRTQVEKYFLSGIAKDHKHELYPSRPNLSVGKEH